MTMFLRRSAQFSAGLLSGGGHDYRIEVTVGGKIDEVTGMVVNIKDIDALIKAWIIHPLHKKILDRDVPAFLCQPATLENIAIFLWNICASHVPEQCALSQLTLVQDSTTRVQAARPKSHQLSKESDRLMLILTRVYDFSASHRLHAPLLTQEENQQIFGKCNWMNGHGHNYQIEVSVAGETDPATGTLISVDHLDRIVEQEVLAPYDHRHLNYDVPEFQNLNPTSENLTKVIWDKIVRHQGELGPARLFRIAVQETERNYFEYYGE